MSTGDKWIDMTSLWECEKCGKISVVNPCSKCGHDVWKKFKEGHSDFKKGGVVGSVSKVFEICNAYESGVGHGVEKDGKSEPPFSDKDLNEAYVIGYGAGTEMADEKAAKDNWK